MENRVVKVHASKDYDVIIGKDLLKDAGKCIKKVSSAKRALLVSDDLVYPLYGGMTEASLSAAGFEVSHIILTHGEAEKTMGTLTRILETGAECNLMRDDIMVALGGGVIGDMTGFAAAVYMRGISFVQLPTTLLAAVDASVGGKTAVDLEHGKNLAGAFWQPSLVLCDCNTFETLPDEQIANGMSEAIKYGIIWDESILINAEEGITKSGFPELVERCIAIKRDIVEADERENGVRKLLNFGHTIGHAVEKYSNYHLGHGFAVAIGMVYEARIAEKLGLCSGLSQRLAECLKKYGLPTEADVPKDQLISLMKHDKKNQGGHITTVLPVRCGECVVRSFTTAEINEILA